VKGRYSPFRFSHIITARGDRFFEELDNDRALAEFQKTYDAAPTHFETLLRICCIYNEKCVWDVSLCGRPIKPSRTLPSNRTPEGSSYLGMSAEKSPWFGPLRQKWGQFIAVPDIEIESLKLVLTSDFSDSKNFGEVIILFGQGIMQAIARPKN